ncbi:MAG TPA: flippase [Acidobacteriaceae bacterium]|nr:flippase [Acidobacteriaceae bacterium]
MDKTEDTRSWSQRIRNSRITHNIAALFGTQAAAYVFPLLTIPYLARVLGPAHFGMVAFAQSLGLYLAIVVEFGFQLSATRRVARFRDDREQLEQIVSGVMGAKVLLALICIAITLVLQYFMPSFHHDTLILWAGAFSGIGQGFSMLWFYQGMEQMKLPAAMDMLGKAVAAAGVFLFVHRPQDAWKVLALQCICYCGAALVLLVIASREVRVRWPHPRETRQAIRDSAAMFLFRSSVGLYTTANALILGAVANPTAVAFYSGAERLTKALLNMLNPVSLSLYPRLCRLIATDRKRAVWLARVSLGAMTLGSLLLAAGAFVAAPLIIRIVLGKGYEAAVPVMRVLSLLLPAVAVSTVLGLQWMLPLRMDAAYNKIIVSAGCLNLALAFLWASRWQQLGMAWAVVTSEYMVTAAVFIVLTRRRLSPFSDNPELRLQIEKGLAQAGEMAQEGGSC